MPRKRTAFGVGNETVDTCIREDHDCGLCSLSSYGRDCMGRRIGKAQRRVQAGPALVDGGAAYNRGKGRVVLRHAKADTLQPWEVVHAGASAGADAVRGGGAGV